jgi:hypothetical protein
MRDAALAAEAPFRFMAERIASIESMPPNNRAMISAIAKVGASDVRATAARRYDSLVADPTRNGGP